MIQSNTKNSSKSVVAIAAAIGGLAVSAGSANAATVYDSLVTPAPGNVVSQGFQATATKALGDHVVLAGTDRELTTITMGLSSWAKKSDWPLVGDADSFSHPLTVNVYSVTSPASPTPGVGSLLATKTITADVPYRPEVFGFNGIYFTTNFDFSDQNVTLPDDVIVTLAFNTQTYGETPIGVGGPYNSLNAGLRDTTVYGAPSIGSDVQADNAFWDSTYAGRPTGLAIDNGWTPYTSTMAINAVPEPAGLGLLALASAAVGLRRRRR